MTDETAPLKRPFDLRDLGQAGASVTLTLDSADRDRLAHWAEVERVDSFSAKIDAQKLSASRFKLSAHLEADVSQNCVVTLEPVRSRIVRDFSRELHLVSPAKRESEASAELILDAGDDEEPEEIESLTIDLAAPVLEEFILGIDPYPRGPGVAFKAPGDGESGPKSPFAVLKALKTR